MLFSRLLLFFFFSSSFLTAQNLVSNPSFEEVGNLPIKPNKRNSYEFEPHSGYIPFQRNVKFWFNGSKTTPDLRITDKNRLKDCQKRYKDCDEARTGKHSVGIITYMKNPNTDTYREYVQIKLKKTLRPGVKTYTELWIRKERQSKLVTNNIGFHFSYHKVYKETEETIGVLPQINCDSIISLEHSNWVKIETSFLPEQPFNYLTIGNFFENDKTQHATYEKYSGSPYIPPYAYYLIDDIRVWQEGDEPEKPIIDLTKVKKNEPFQLKNITFKTASSELDTVSFKELNRLFSFLEKNPEIKIAIYGHTDDQGNDDFNLNLSKNRAKAVFTFLMQKGIPEEQISFAGFGEQKPINSNTTEEGRANNRRVEFLMIE